MHALLDLSICTLYRGIPGSSMKGKDNSTKSSIPQTC